ncbi:2-phospho-L-lactate guanylyltransferase [uncultured Jatrophihabitans sp.]|uniref:2-phospho-L-lactate guanylyltransferase n=1 Tax=uncultured Jatrophihabitans sp. TaxID=1610747 RepID=UPI0035CC3B34
MPWTVLIPAKSLPAAKSRLAPRAADAAGHARLVEAIRADTLSAARSATGVARVLLVVDRPGEWAPVGAQVVVQRRDGLNAALTDAAADARSSWPDDGVAALLGDLPALRPAELADALRQAADLDAGYVPDAEGNGTTMLTAAPGRQLQPQFGAGSAAQHAAVARLIEAGPGLRRDVDTADDLLAAVALGLGAATREELASAAEIPSSPGDGIVRA